MPEQTRRCPHCGGTILAAARKCKHCRNYFEPLEPWGAKPLAVTDQPLPPPAVRPRVRARRLLVIGSLTFVVAAGALAAVFLYLHKQAQPKPDPLKAALKDLSAMLKKPRPQQVSTAAELRGLIAGRVSESDCRRLRREGHVPFVLCQALAEATIDGRTSPAGRRAIRTFLTERGYFRLHARIVHRHDVGVYEIYRYGRRQHALLLTNLTQYSSQGRFALWAKRVGSREIKTVNGFTQAWDVFREDAFGSVVQAVFDAPAGEQTMSAARTALRALLIISRPGA